MNSLIKRIQSYTIAESLYKPFKLAFVVMTISIVYRCSSCKHILKNQFVFLKKYEYLVQEIGFQIRSCNCVANITSISNLNLAPNISMFK